MMPTEIDARVVAVVREWSAAREPEAAGDVLAAARRDLSTDLHFQLVHEVAEITAELALALLSAPTTPTSDENVTVDGVELHPEQALRLEAWAEAQRASAEGLGLSAERWKKALEAGFDRCRARIHDDPSLAAPAAAEAEGPSTAARQLIGARVAQSFEARPEPGGEQAGLRGILAARSFGKPTPRKKR